MLVNERGGTLLVQDENAALITLLPEGRGSGVVPTWVVATWVPDNYPAFNVSTPTMPEATLRRRLQAEYAGWTARKNNIGLDLDEAGCVKEMR